MRRKTHVEKATGAWEYSAEKYHGRWCARLSTNMSWVMLGDDGGTRDEAVAKRDEMVRRWAKEILSDEWSFPE